MEGDRPVVPAATAIVSALPPFQTFDLSDTTTIGQRWPKWLKRFDNYTLAFGITDDSRKRALLLHYAGETVQDLFDTLPAAVGANTYEATSTALNDYFMPKKCEEYLIYLFREAKQNEGEQIDAYVSRLRELAKDCNFADIDKELKIQLIQHCRSTRLRRRALREPMTLNQFLAYARSLELSDTQAGYIETQENAKPELREQVQAVYRKKDQLIQKPHFSTKEEQKCYRCGGSYPHAKQKPCPAIGATCRLCDKSNHFARVCLSGRKKEDAKNTATTSKQKYRYKNVQTKRKENHRSYAVQASTSESSDESESIYALLPHLETKLPTLTIGIQDKHVPVLFDTGASVNLMPEKSFKENFPNLQLQSTKVQVMPYGTSKPVPLLGKFTAVTKYQMASCSAVFYVTKNGHHSLLGYKTAVDLGVIAPINAMTQEEGEFEQLLRQYPALTVGIGKLKNVQVHIPMREDVVPIVNTRYRIPFHQRAEVERELNRLQAMGIIERAEGPTTWVSPLLVVPKQDNKIRLCVNLIEVNKGIQRERHVMPTTDEIVAQMAGVTTFTKLDLNEGYWQLELHPDSRNVTTFATHVGLFRFTRLCYGLCNASEIFQREIEKVIRPVCDVRNVSDDVIIPTKASTSHKDTVSMVMRRLAEHGLTLNKAKCVYKKKNLRYLGLILSDEGLTPDPRRVEAIREMPQPQNETELRSLLGMLTFCARFIPNFATLSEPLRSLNKKDSVWKWTATQSKAMDEILSHLTSATSMAYFDLNLFTDIKVDASPVGLGAVLTQKKSENAEDFNVIAYASRSLTPVEQRYSQTEREALAVVWGAEHFHQYIYGSRFRITTDHKPLVSIFNTARHSTTARIDRWKIRLHEYDTEVVYCPGKNNPADYLSRAGRTVPEAALRPKITKEAEAVVNAIINHKVIQAITEKQVIEETAKDIILQRVKQAVLKQNWDTVLESCPKEDKATFMRFYRMRNEITTASNGEVLLKGSCLIIPQTLQSQVIEIAHESHQGMVRTKQLLREAVWFPDIDRKVDCRLAKCLPCLATTNKQPPPPIAKEEHATKPWVEVSLDFTGPFPSGDYIMVVIDDYSKFPETAVLHSTAAPGVCKALESIFARHGVPVVLKTDNAPPFTSHAFKEFARTTGFHHRRITPHAAINGW